MRSTLFVLTILMSAATSFAQDWPQWRGPSRTGVTHSFKAPAAWPDRPRQVWKVDAGEGHASPVVAAGRAYLLSRLGDRETVTALDLAIGKQIWRQAYEAPYQMNPSATGHGKGPKATPLLSGGRLYTLGISGILSAWDAASGKLHWRKDFKSDFPITSPDFGTSTSPIVVGDLVIVHAGGAKGGALLALDVATGGVKWSWKGDGPGYASPILAEFSKVRQIVTLTQKQIVGVGVEDGTLLWSLPFTTEYEQNVVTPVAVGDLVIYGGISKPTTAVRIGQTDGKWVTEQVWQNADLPMYMSSPVEKDGLLFGLSHRNRGQLFCLDPRTGKTLWTTRGREAENAAIVGAGNVLLATTTEGELIVFRPDGKAFDEIRRYTVADSPVWAHPVPAGQGVLIKDAASLTYWIF